MSWWFFILVIIILIVGGIPGPERENKKYHFKKTV